jgi:hypothetical protein
MSDILERMDAGWQNLLDAVDGIPDERLTEPGASGDWSVKDVLGHVAYWQGRVPFIVERVTSANPAASAGGSGSWDFEQINQEQHAKRAGSSLADIREEFFATHESALASLREHPDIDPASVAGNMWDHYDEHAESIRDWRQRAGV